jgi:hypothetical protein
VKRWRLHVGPALPLALLTAAAWTIVIVAAKLFS